MSEIDKLVRAGFIFRRARGKETQSAFARRAGIDQTSLSRIESDAQDPGVTNTQIILGRLGLRLDFDLVPDSKSSNYPLLRAGADLTNDQRVLQRIPEPLRSRRHDSDISDGPSSSEAVYWMRKCQSLSARASEPVDRLQSTYSSLISYNDRYGQTVPWRYERDRDLIHVLFSCGKGAQFAYDTIYDALSRVRPEPNVGWGRKNRPAPVRLGRLAWCRAVYAVAAEAAICAMGAKFCRDSVQVAFDHDESLRRLAESQSRLQTVLDGGNDYSDSFAETHKTTVLNSEVAEKEARKRRKGFGNRGGSPRLEDIGNAGERILSIELLQLSERAWTLYDDMVDDVFMDWHTETGTELPSRDF